MTRRSASHGSKSATFFSSHCRLFETHNREGIGSSTGISLGLSLLRNRRLAAKDILLDLARRCFWQLGYEVNFLRRLEVRQMITDGYLAIKRSRTRTT